VSGANLEKRITATGRSAGGAARVGSRGLHWSTVAVFYTFQVSFVYTLILFFHTMELQTLALKSIEIHRKLKTLELQLKAANSALQDAMVSENVSTIKVKQRTVSLVTRNIKDFGDDINQQELLLKAEKKRREVMGQFTIASTSQSIRIN
jgi:hypothetical protein